jgi:DNA polymerase-3 subunit alpha
MGMNDLENAKTTHVNKPLTVGGIVTGLREGQTKNNKPYAIVKIEDFTGSGEIALFGDDFVNYAKYCRLDMYLFIKGTFTPRKYNNSVVDFRIESIQYLADVKEKGMKSLSVSIPLLKLDKSLIADLSALIKNNPGNTSLYFKIEDIEKQIAISLITENQKFLLDKNIVRYLEDNKIEFTIK